MFIYILLYWYVGPNTYDIVKHGSRNTVVNSFPAGNPNYRIVPLSNDPGNKEFLTLSLTAADTGQEMGRFRVDNIVQMRQFMASLGVGGKGLFTKRTEGNQVPVEATHGLWDVIHPSEDELSQRQQVFDDHKKADESDKTAQHTDAPPTYEDTMHQLPLGFYFPEGADTNQGVGTSQPPGYPGSTVPQYDPSATLPKANRRAFHDTFNPPHGPPTFYPVSIGYGPEIGLGPNQQALWDPIHKT